MEELIIKPFNQTYIIHESGDYHFAIEEKSNDSIILMQDEIDLILKYRDSSSDTRAMIHTLLDSANVSH